MDRNLYVERWLLLLEQESQQSGFIAVVRALDYKGGNWLAFAVRRDDKGLDLRYRKRLNGPAMVVAATSVDIVRSVREIHERLIDSHRRLRENGLRRFLKRSIRLLAELEKSMHDDKDLPQRLQNAFLQVKDAPPDVRPCPAARKKHGLNREHEILPAAYRKTEVGLAFAGIRDGNLVNLALLAPHRKNDESDARDKPGEKGHSWMLDVLTVPADLGADLAFTTMLLTEPHLPAPPVTDLPAGAIADVGSALAEGAGAGLADAGASMVGDVAAQGGSACADASCAGLDCGAIDCVPG